jgi:hypothetical protein
MKEITRRLYTKPVMLSMLFLVAVGVVVGLFVTAKSRAQATIYIQQGDDKFETTGNGETYHNFSASKIPADFFGPGSQEYSGVVPLVGVPLATGSDIDTIIHRNQDVYVPGSPTTTLTMTALSLKSINPISVAFPGRTEAWNVFVSLSTVKASTGSMTVNAGGTFDSSLKVWPKFTFKRVSDNATLVLDTGDPDGPGLTASSQATASESETEPAPQPAPTIAPCHTAIDEFESGSFDSATASSSSCAPVTLTSTNSPWQPCGTNGFCIPRPITEQELLASHNASPPGTKKAIAARTTMTATQ